MEQRYVARVPGGLCYQTHAEATMEAANLKEPSMLLEVRGYWIVLSRSTLVESLAAIDAVEAASAEMIRLVKEARLASEAALTPVVMDDPSPPVKTKERKHG